MVDQIKKKFDEYYDLNYVKSRQDPEEEPYRTKYQARKLIENLIANLNLKLENNSGHDSSTFLTTDELKHLNSTYEFFCNRLDSITTQLYDMTAKSYLICKFLQFNLAKNYIETEEIESGEKIIEKILSELENMTNVYNPLVIGLKLACFNELIFVWSHRADYKKSLSLVLQIDLIYEIFTKESPNNFVSSTNENNFSTMPFEISELMLLNHELSVNKRRKIFEALYTHSLFFFAQVYGKLDEKEKSAYYCRLTLQRQLDEYNEKLIEKVAETNNEIIDYHDERVVFDPLDWATHAAAISQYYMCQDDFPTARHCLCCAEAILESLHKDSKLREKNNNSPEEKLNEQTQSIRRCWGKFAIELLKLSKKRLLESADEPNQKKLLLELDKPSQFRFNMPQDVFKLDFYEKNAITSNIALDYEQARKIFLKGQEILNEAKEFFKLDGFVSDHCEIVRDLSELYGALIFFEEDVDRRCKMIKRRLDLLIPISNEINEQYYLFIKRQSLFDIASIYSDLMDAKLDIFKSKKESNKITIKESAKAIEKINTLAKSSIDYFEKFLTTMKVQPKREVLPDKIDEHNFRSALLAKFYIGRLYSKIITTEPKERLNNAKSTLDNYTFLVKYCDKEEKDGNSSVIERMKIEYNICKEMITFLPAQMEKIRTLIV